MQVACDCLILGSGVAGLSLALKAQAWGKVVVVTKRHIDDAATTWAQGGIAAVVGEDDSVEDHAGDTLEVGCGLADRQVVELVVGDGARCIEELLALGMHLTRVGGGASGALDLTREGGHSARRIVHSDDMTGRELQRTLLAAVHACPNIEVLEHHMAIDLIETSKFGGPRRIIGAYVLNAKSGEVSSVVSPATVLATGGAGKVYLYTSNPDIATGDGIAMAYRAGAVLADLEFFQFHPTCLFHPEVRNFLISEALRGEGGVLRLPDGEAFMHRHHPRADLAPRDVVARAIDYEMKRTGHDCVHLDMSARSADYLRQRFPNIHAQCLACGIDLTCQPIPVVPAAHYACGGVWVDPDGATSLPGLWAIGEVACTGLHGANRLASNSLLEALVFSDRAATAIGRLEHGIRLPHVPSWDAGKAAASDEAVVVSHNWDEIRRSMWNYVGIVRSERRLRRAARRIALLQDEIREYYWQHLVTPDLLELRNIADVAEAIVSCAAHRRESRGLHYTLDHLQRDDAHFGGHTLLTRGSLPFISRQPF